MVTTLRSRSVSKVAIVGSGQVGPDVALHMAQALLPHGVSVVVVDISDDALGVDRALELVRRYAADHEGFPVPRSLEDQTARKQPWRIPVVLRDDEDGIAVLGHLSRAVDAVLCKAIVEGARLGLDKGLELESECAGEVCRLEDSRIGMENLLRNGPRTKAEFLHRWTASRNQVTDIEEWENHRRNAETQQEGAKDAANDT